MKEAQIKVDYIDHMGTDLSVVNAARSSFGKESDWEADGSLKKADANLIRFLASGFRTEEWDELADKFLRAETRSEVQAMLKQYKNSAQHWAPFAHPHVSLRIKAPIFIARQMVKHQVGGVWSEVSRRYVSDEPEFWFPKEWHTRPENVKQGSGDALSGETEYAINYLSRNFTDYALSTYNNILGAGVAPEEARSVLPLNTMTEWVWTGSLAFWARVGNQRLDGHAQLAAQETARGIRDIVAPLYPVSWAALVS